MLSIIFCQILNNLSATISWNKRERSNYCFTGNIPVHKMGIISKYFYRPYVVKILWRSIISVNRIRTEHPENNTWIHVGSLILSFSHHRSWRLCSCVKYLLTFREKLRTSCTEIQTAERKRHFFCSESWNSNFLFYKYWQILNSINKTSREWR